MTNVFPLNHWEIGQSEVVIRDEKREDTHNIIMVAINRISFISYKIDK